jgi:TolB protein
VAPEAGTRIYIPVGDPGVKKVMLAIEPTIGGDEVGQEFFQNMNNNMDFVDLFDMLPLTKLPEKRGNLNAYKIVGAEFVIQSEMKKVEGRYEVTVQLLDVNKGVVILARRYPFVGGSTQVGRELANYAGNDIIQVLTGEPGIFRTRFLMSCGKKNRRDIYMMDFDGQNLRQLTNDHNMVLSPSWAPDGKRILFTAYRSTRPRSFVNPNLYMMDLVTNKQQVIASDPGLNSGGVFRPGYNQIAYVFSRMGRPELFLLDRTKNSRMQLSDSQSKYFSVEPTWSPNGAMLAYSSHAYSKKDESHPHIYVANADGSGRKRLTFAGTYNSSPNWSPKGDKIAFSGQENRANNFNIFTINPKNGEDLQRLTDGSDSKENPVFSPDGRFIAYSGNASGEYRIYIMTANGTRIRALTPPGLGSCKQPVWSPRL